MVREEGNSVIVDKCTFLCKPVSVPGIILKIIVRLNCGIAILAAGPGPYECIFVPQYPLTSSGELHFFFN